MQTSEVEMTLVVLCGVTKLCVAIDPSEYASMLEYVLCTMYNKNIKTVRNLKLIFRLVTIANKPLGVASCVKLYIEMDLKHTYKF
jgi:hypothetical protein